MQATVHSSISQWLKWQGPPAATVAPPNSGSAAAPSANRVPSAYPAALLWCCGAVVSAGSFVIVLQVAPYPSFSMHCNLVHCSVLHYAMLITIQEGAPILASQQVVKTLANLKRCYCCWRSQRSMMEDCPTLGRCLILSKNRRFAQKLFYWCETGESDVCIA